MCTKLKYQYPQYLSAILCMVLFSLLVLIFPLQAFAGQTIKVLALFSDRALVVVDGSQKLLKKDQSFKGVKLISADSDSAVLEVQGRRKKYLLGSEISTSYKKQDPKKVLVVWKNKYNMFQAEGKINNSSVTFIIDTGATTVALNSGTARSAGIDYKKGRQALVQTASGIVKAYQVKLNKVNVGHIQLYNVNGMVLEGSYPTQVLLGQSFLGRIHMIRDGDKMNLRKKY